MESDPDKPKSPKADKATVLLRVDAVLRLLIAGAQTHDVLQYASAPEQNWGVTERQVHTYIARARKELERLAKDRKRKALVRQIVQHGDLYGRALASGEYRACLAILEAERLLLGIDPPLQRRIREMSRQVDELIRQMEDPEDEPEEPMSQPPREEEHA